MSPPLRRARAPLLFAGALALCALAVAAQPPVRWQPTGTALRDFTIARDTLVARAGGASLRFHAAEEPDGFAAVGTSVDAAPWIGRRVRLVAMLRPDGLAGDGGAIWLRADGDRPPSVAFANSQREPVVGTGDWRPVQVEIDVPVGARRLVFGALSAARGTLYVDELRLEAVGAAGAPPPVAEGFEHASSVAATVAAGRAREAPRALTPRGLENVVAFTRLLGYVRFFHPSDEVARTDWDAFAVRGVRAVEGARDAEALAGTLRALFVSVAPSVAIHPSGAAPPPPPARPAGATGIVYWLHAGVGLPTASGGPVGRSLYVSRRVMGTGAGGLPSLAERMAMGRLLADSLLPPPPDPRTPLQVALGGGVSASVPLALWRATPPPDSLRGPRAAPAGVTYGLRDRATRLGGVALAWGVFEHFYPYFDVVRPDWDAALADALRAAATDADARAYVATLERMLATLHDGHGNVTAAGLTTAVPPVSAARVEGRVVVTAVDARVDLRPGDEIVSVDGRPVEEVWRELAGRTSSATAQYLDRVVAVRLLVGVPGDSLRLRVRDPLTPGTAVREVVVARGARPLPVPPQLAPIDEPRPGIVYLDLGRVTDDAVTAALPRLRAAHGVVVDMRGYPRTVSTPRVLALFADAALRSARFEVPLVTHPDRQAWRFVDGAWPVPPDPAPVRAPVAFLTGGGAISYAETTMGIVEAFHLGDIVGEPTAGTNGNVNPFTLPGNVRVSWTGMRVRKHDGSPHHGVGIAPTIPVRPTIRGIRDGRDEVLERGLEAVQARARR